MELSELRALLDQIDDGLLELLSKRAEVIPKIRATKAAQGLATVDPKREQAVLERLRNKGAGAFPVDAIGAVFREIMSASTSMQSSLRVGFLGPEGTYSHLAARTLFGYAPDYIEEGTIGSVIESVVRKRAQYGVVPLENSTEGSVSSTVDALLRAAGFWNAGEPGEPGCMILRELVLPVSHCLITHATELSAVERIYSHPQALGQCRQWIQDNLPTAQLVQTSSTSAAVAQAQSDRGGAALGSKLAAEIHDLPVLRHDVQDESENRTRFVVVANRDAPVSGDDKTTLAFMISDDHAKGSLRRTLECFEEHEINLARIESRPVPGQDFRYVFVADAVGHRLDESMARCLSALAGATERVQVLGSFPRFTE